MIYVMYVILGLWVILNIVVVVTHSLRSMAREFWVEQNIFGKICANIFYALAWVFNSILTLAVFVIGFVLLMIYRLFKLLMSLMSPYYVKAKNLLL